jgi:2',3'-cyclic-nucleotide 2'-phosphodiesterase (5'-nucleotidase family)
LVRATDSNFYSIEQVVLNADFSLERVDFEEFGLGNFVADAMKIIGEEVTGKTVDFAFQANGTIRSDIVPGAMPWSKNQISFFDLAAVNPLGMGKDDFPGYPLVSVYATEQEVIRAVQITSILHQIYGDIFFLQFSGLRYTYDPGKAFWMKVPIINLPIPANKAVLSIDK